ncbi:hypothetical protein [Solidesulfovibrio sp. C21]|uniref:hypothetical protein n=1 Tax=Solidesulfovibrio sp. C21 TaxID=3398613 RepID=UPI0039FDBF4C
MAIIFSLEKNPERFIRVPEAPGAIFHVRPMASDEELAFDKTYISYDRQTKRNIIADPIKHLEDKCVRVVLGWEKLPGRNGYIPYSTENMVALCHTTAGAALMFSVLADAGAADAVEAEVAEKNS